MKPLEVGERVAVYGWVQMHHQPYHPRAGGRGSVVWIGAHHVHVRFDKAINGEVGGDDIHYEVDPRQCRRLIKRGSRVKVEHWVVIYPGAEFIYLHERDLPKPNPDIIACVRLVGYYSPKEK